MIEVNIPCNTILNFNDGVVTGHIVVSPETILTSVVFKIHIDYSGPERVSVSKLIAKMHSYLLSEGKYTDIKIFSGQVDREFYVTTLHHAIDLLAEYLHIEELCRRINDLNSDTKVYLEDFLKLQSYIYRCDDCNCYADTANVSFI